MSKLIDVGDGNYITSDAIRDPNEQMSQTAINSSFKSYLNGLLMIYVVHYTPSGTICTEGSYPNINGYTLVTALRVQTDGFIGTPYIITESDKVAIWDKNFVSPTSDMKYTVTFLFIKNM